jgi:Fatty acid hydroxylase superfamily
LEAIFNTPSHHRVHHATNPRYLDRNYAGMFIVWDRLFGTFSEESDSEKPQYGIVHNLRSYNPIIIAFHEWAAMARDLVHSKSLREFVLLIFGPPGWRADGSGSTTQQIRAAWADVHARADSLRR